MSAHYLLGQLVDFDQTCMETPFRRGAKIIRFWWPWHIYKVTPALWMSNFDKKSLSELYLFNQIMDSGQTLHIVSLGLLKQLIRFMWPWHNFQGHHTIKMVKISFVYTLSSEPIGGFWPNSKETSIEHGEEMIRFCWPWPHFQGHTCTLNVKFWQKNLSALYLLNQIMDSGQTFRTVSLG